MGNTNKDKTGRLIRYIIDNIVDSSYIIDDEFVEVISVPWVDGSWNDGTNEIPFHWITSNYPMKLYYDFVEYVKNTYGVGGKYEDSKWLFNEVIFKLKVKISDYKRSLRRNVNESKEDRFINFIYDDFINNFTKIRRSVHFPTKLIFLPPIDDDEPVEFSVYELGYEGSLRKFEPDEKYDDWFLDNEVVKLFKNRYGMEDVDKIHDIWLGIIDRLYMKMRGK